MVCPGCRVMLRLPGPDDETLPLVIAPGPGMPEEVEEIDPADPGEAPAGGDWKFMAGLALPALGLLGLFAWWMAPGDKPPPPAALPEPVATAGPDSAKPPAAPARNLLLEVEAVVKGFLTAGNEEEILKFVREPEKAAPKIKEWLAGGSYTAPGFREVLGDGISSGANGDLLVVTVRTGDFEAREIVLVDSGDAVKVDWESWVGWSEMTWPEFKEKRPTDGKWFRVLLTDVEYYNFDFTDEDAWASFRLDSPDKEESLYGYVPRTGELARIIPPFEKGATVKLLVRLRYPEGARSGTQVLIDALSGDGWVELPAKGGP